MECQKIAFRQNMKLIIFFFQTILSLSTSKNELLQKLKAYQALTGISDELIVQYFEKVGLYKPISKLSPASLHTTLYVFGSNIEN